MRITSNSQDKRIIFFIVNLIIVGCFATACDQPASESPQQAESIGQIAVAATNASEGVLLIREYATDKDSWEYTEAKRLYGEAQAGFNGWIEQFKADLAFNNVEPDAEEYNRMLVDAVQKTDDFLKHVEQVKQANAPSGSINNDTVEGTESERDDVSLVVIVAQLAPILIDLAPDAIAIWNSIQDADVQKREGQLKYLDTLKWQSFEDIK